MRWDGFVFPAASVTFSGSPANAMQGFVLLRCASSDYRVFFCGGADEGRLVMPIRDLERALDS